LQLCETGQSEAFHNWLTHDGKLHTRRMSDSGYDYILRSKMDMPAALSFLLIEEKENATVKIPRRLTELLIEESNDSQIPGVIWVYFWRTNRVAAVSVHMAGSAPRDSVKKCFDIPIGWFHSWAAVDLDDWADFS
jgi:hypothetical protein